jgi:hypothetical protein
MRSRSRHAASLFQMEFEKLATGKVEGLGRLRRTTY